MTDVPSPVRSFGPIRGELVDWRHSPHRSKANRGPKSQSFLSSSFIGSVLITLFMFILLHMSLHMLMYDANVSHLTVYKLFCLSYVYLNKNIEQEEIEGLPTDILIGLLVAWLLC